jgi:hypothetical protein
LSEEYEKPKHEVQKTMVGNVRRFWDAEMF